MQSGGAFDPYIAGLNRLLDATIPFKGTFNSLGDTFTNFAHRVGGPLGAITSAWGGFMHVLGQGSGASQTVRDLQQLQQQADRFGSDAQTVTGHLGQLAKMFGGNLVEGMGAAQAAGVTVSQMMSKQAKVWGSALIQVNSLILGYEQFGQKAGALGSDINAITYAQSNQLKQMQTLNSAWDTFITNVTGPRTSFIKLAGDLNTFGTDAKLAGAQFSGLGTSYTAASKSISANALQLQGDFQGTITDANAMLDTLRTSGAPAGVFDGVVKNVVQALIPLSGHSRAAHAEIAALAQEAGGPASHNIGVLSAWAGKTKDPMLAMEEATNKATIATSNLGDDAKKTTTILQGFINNGIAIQAAAMTQLSAKIKTYIYDLDHYGASDSRTEAAQTALNNAIQKSRQIAADAANGTDGMATAQDNYQKKLANTQSTQAKFIDNLVSGQVNSQKAKTDLQAFTDSILTNTQNTSQGQAARTQLLADLKAAGYDSSTAQGMLFLYTQAIEKNQTATDNAQAARSQMILDLVNSGKWSTAAKLDLEVYTTAVQNNQTKTQLAQGARQQLIKDLENAGLSANTAKRLVEEYTTALTKIPKNEPTSIKVTGTGHWTVTGGGGTTALGTGGHGQRTAPGGAAGGLATEGGFLAQHAYGGAVAGQDSNPRRAHAWRVCDQA